MLGKGGTGAGRGGGVASMYHHSIKTITDNQHSCRKNCRFDNKVDNQDAILIF